MFKNDTVKVLKVKKVKQNSVCVDWSLVWLFIKIERTKITKDHPVVCFGYETSENIVTSSQSRPFIRVCHNKAEKTTHIHDQHPV